MPVPNVVHPRVSDRAGLLSAVELGTVIREQSVVALSSSSRSFIGGSGAYRFPVAIDIARERDCSPSGIRAHGGIKPGYFLGADPIIE